MATRPQKRTIQRTPPAGFDLRKYEPFRQKAGGSHAQLSSLWCNALFVRQTIKRLILEGSSEEAQRLADKLISDPTDSCGYATQYLGAGRIDLDPEQQTSVTTSYSQGTTWATRSVDLSFLDGDSATTDTEGSDYIDDIYFDTVAGKYGPKGFVTVSLFASDDQIRSDFSRWLTAIRRTRAIKAPTKEGPDDLIKKWSRYGVLPFLDLYHLWAPAHGAQYRKLDVVKSLHPEKPIHSLVDFADKTLRQAATLALNPRVLSYLATSHRD